MERIAVVCGNVEIFHHYINSLELPIQKRTSMTALIGERYYYYVSRPEDVYGRIFDGVVREHGWQSVRDIDRIIFYLNSHLNR